MDIVKFKIEFKDNEATSDQARAAVKKIFLNYGFSYTQEYNSLTVTGKGVESDFGIMWSIVLDLIEFDWFVKNVSSCVYMEGEEREDVISQLPELKKILETA